MGQIEVKGNDTVGNTETQSSAYVPPLQLTEGQRPPIAANGGLSYMSFDRDGDAGTAAALEDALAQIAEGEGQKVIDMLDNAPPGINSASVPDEGVRSGTPFEFAVVFSEFIDS